MNYEELGRCIHGNCTHTIGTIYVIGSNEFRPVKIGWTIRLDVSDRLRDLQSGNPYEMYPLAVYGGCLCVESALHKEFSSKNVRGEWFLFGGPKKYSDGLNKISRAIVKIKKELKDDCRKCYPIRSDEIICKQCDKPFRPRYFQSMFCSNKCSAISKSERMKK
jgi:hypothetical protein